MKNKDAVRLVDYFHTIEDPRIERNKGHLLWDILVLTICAVVCGCETWEEKQECFFKLGAGDPGADSRGDRGD